MRKLVGTLIPILLLMACEPAPQVGLIEPAALQARVEAGDAPTILDVRTPEEFAIGHIPGAINIPHDQLASRVSELDPGSDIALYCMLGPRARLGEKTLGEAGRKGLLHLEGGFSAWEAAGFPAESGMPAP